MKNKIYDCFMFNNENDLLNIRLNILNKYVDYFVIIESSETHSGLKKKLYFDVEKFPEFKNKIKDGISLDQILPEAFALVREASKRTRNEKHFEVQLVGGIVLHESKIAEMRTGEGKTLTITLAAYLNALSEKGVHIVTVNDYLAKRDSQEMGQIYNFLEIGRAHV